MKEWDTFFDTNKNPTKDQVLKERDRIEQKVWKNQSDIPID